ncbi:YeeE/YedE thiosulfate transporter family protein [Pyruvatibacter mobilis]|uniref:YeeE/YedE thiosulfate transporter family protein n=1 Tax=Pyruvatibacter mobilis TaxID=1712261 RepID=UPI003BACD796
MSILAMVLVGLLMGIVFGVALEKSRVFEPGMIVGQFQLRNFIMVKMFLTASATGLVVLAGLNGFGFVELHPKAAIYTATIVGGLLMGGGMAIAGACPGTVLAQIGSGYKDAIAVFAGGILGAMAFGYLEPTLKPILLTGGSGKITYADLLGMPFWQLALIAAAIIVVALALLERRQSWHDELGDDFDGCFEVNGTKSTSSAAGTPTPAE